MTMRRYDVYGFRSMALDAAAEMVERALGVRLWQRDSSYRGTYYSGGVGAGHEYLLERNGDGARWHREFADYPVTLMINDLPDMDGLQQRLVGGRSEPVLLRTIVSTTEPPEELEPDDDEPR
jgi:hypothetical protein